MLDNCDNYSEAANPDAFCSDHLTFRGKPKQEGVQVEDFRHEDDSYDRDNDNDILYDNDDHHDNLMIMMIIMIIS